MIESHLFAGYLVLLRDVFQTSTVLSTKGQRPGEDSVTSFR